MNWVRRHPIFSGILALGVSMVIGEGWLVGERWHTAGKVRQRLINADTELRSLHVKTPPLTGETTETMRAQLSEALSALKRLREDLSAEGDPADGLQDTAESVQRADGYFEIASFVERMREHAVRRGVDLKPEEYFGFSDYSHTGPDPEDISTVLRARWAMEVLLDALLEARPIRLIAVQRERRFVSGNNPIDHRPANASMVRADYFDWDQRDSVGVAESIDARALRVSFVSHTVSLRTLLNKLAELKIPLVVRAVEVDQGPISAEGRRTAESEIKTPPLLVSQAPSRFTVTVELIEWVDEFGAES